MLVLDANILIRAVLGRRVRALVEAYGGKGARFLAPDVAFEDAERHLLALLIKRGKPRVDVPATLGYLRSLIELVGPEVYGTSEAEARLRLKGRDEDDWPVLAAALAMGCGVWTEDEDFFGTGIAVWTTNRVEILLKKQVKSGPDE